MFRGRKAANVGFWPGAAEFSDTPGGCPNVSALAPRPSYLVPLLPESDPWAWYERTLTFQVSRSSTISDGEPHANVCHQHPSQPHARLSRARLRPPSVLRWSVMHKQRATQARMQPAGRRQQHGCGQSARVLLQAAAGLERLPRCAPSLVETARLDTFHVSAACTQPCATAGLRFSSGAPCSWSGRHIQLGPAARTGPWDDHKGSHCVCWHCHNRARCMCPWDLCFSSCGRAIRVASG